MQAPLHLPLDFELREDVRRLAQKLRSLGDGESNPDAWVAFYRMNAKSVAAIFFVRLWCDWGRAGSEWRPLETPYAGEAHEWAAESIANIIEEMAEWQGARGGLIRLCIAAGLLLLQNKGDLSGLVLNDFWRHNEHLSPDFKSVQARGGLAKARKREMGAIIEMAGQQRELLSRAAQLTFEDALKVTPEEEKKVVALIMRIDRACGLQTRASSEYSEGLLALGLAIIREYGNDQIIQVEAYLHKNQRNPAVVKVPDRVISEFASYHRAATQ